MTVTATVITDSISDEGVRLTTLHLRYPRMIHAELMTHRVFSRNGRSSRAVPVATLLKEDGYLPHFLRNRPGMSATEELEPYIKEQAELLWLDLIEYTKSTVRKLGDLQVHKQWANRPLEWFGYIDVLVTSTDWSNFFALRDEVGAQPEIDQLAKAIKVAMDASEPFPLKPGDWHMPYIRDEDIQLVQDYANEHSLPNGKVGIITLLRKLSVARCARLSYKPFDGNASIEKELERFAKLMEARPVHASPAEHVATPDTKTGHIRIVGWIDNNPKKPIYRETWHNENEHGNFYGWRQYRKMIPYNTINDR